MSKGLKIAFLLATMGLPACVSAPSGYDKAEAKDRAAFADFVSELGGGCVARQNGSFLAEVRTRSGRGSAPKDSTERVSTGTSALGHAREAIEKDDGGFQMEGAWSGEGRAFEAQIISPLGDVLAGFSLDQEGVRVTFAGEPAPALKQRMRAFVDVLAVVGPQGLRRLSCGIGLLDLEGASVFVAHSSHSATMSANLPSGALGALETSRARGARVSSPYVVRGTLRLAGSAVTLESRVSVAAGVTSVHSRAHAGLLLSAGGDVEWRGVSDPSGRRVQPRFLSIIAVRSGAGRSMPIGGKRASGVAGEEFATALTFLEFD